jgi:hypothetical protein
LLEELAGDQSGGTHTRSDSKKAKSSSARCTFLLCGLKKRQQESWAENGQREVQWTSRTKAAKAVGDPKLGNIIRMLTKPP